MGVSLVGGSVCGGSAALRGCDRDRANNFAVTSRTSPMLNDKSWENQINHIAAIENQLRGSARSLVQRLGRVQFSLSPQHTLSAPVPSFGFLIGNVCVALIIYTYGTYYVMQLCNGHRATVRR